jgi:hypothetical protein
MEERLYVSFTDITRFLKSLHNTRSSGNFNNTQDAGVRGIKTARKLNVSFEIRLSFLVPFP